MYHSDLGKSTLDLWGESLPAGQQIIPEFLLERVRRRREELARLARGLAALAAQKSEVAGSGVPLAMNTLDSPPFDTTWGGDDDTDTANTIDKTQGGNDD
ncbi:hypothetical protein L336_0899 [Candidatus Saccharimonas aalborgensis]|uniref:Uncharacterized protein n=1 Tax=Candidatus Saccharimonas aalborgensis TaxID=1332188 RepID=R4PNP2_9BACT|nr:hypothetical protein [Candidatus Saccharimonas aalborgensis]AGL62599.1 hypothetical protein L336_0899 [Candidatus Saccharimonas aalborgensis]QQR51349.1 MAG: hypothetical protein IPF89_00715 [Candidatus Saccharibacteria bacterium]QQS68096.1 MAG: hypothetical protein IPP24_03725 [Candidatus Saccharibacteria bacterium]QQS70423.1 MAG: hypothetical protein IPP92_03760 [Candidatus Saccharibacteria bacterium]